MEILNIGMPFLAKRKKILLLIRAMSWHERAAGIAAWGFIMGLAVVSIIISIWILWCSLRGANDMVATWICRLMALLYGWWRWHDRRRPVDGSAQRNLTMLRLLSPILRSAREYFSSRLILDYDQIEMAKLMGDRPIMFACHPHGIWGVGVLCNLAFRGGLPLITHEFYVATLNLHFAIPLWREFCLVLGLVSVGRRSLINLLKRGKDVVVVLGGAREALDSYPGVMNLTLLSRKGFFRIALEQGAAICPVITFGEVELFKQIRHPTLYLVQVWLMKKLSFALPIFWGRYGPFAGPIPLTTIVGTPIILKPNEIGYSNDENVARIQELYIERVKELHAKYDLRYSPQPTRLTIK